MTAAAPRLTVPRPGTGADVLVVSVPATGGWRTAAAELVAGLERVGARVASVSTGPTPEVRTLALTDLVQAQAARRAAQRALDRARPQAVVYCSINGALRWPQPGAIWFDSLAADNRPGRHGVWQRPVERRRLRQASLLLPWSPGALPDPAPPHSVVLPVPIHTPGLEPRSERDIAALTYAGNPEKKRLPFVLEAWGRARRDGERLLVTGLDTLVEPLPPGTELTGRLAPAEYRALLRRTRVFVAAPTREEYGVAPLEAMAHGCLLVTAPAPGGYPALELARRLDPRLVGSDLAGALRTALDDPAPDYPERAAALLEPYTHAHFDRTLVTHVLPRLLPGWRA